VRLRSLVGPETLCDSENGSIPFGRFFFLTIFIGVL